MIGGNGKKLHRSLRVGVAKITGERCEKLKILFADRRDGVAVRNGG